MWLLTYRQNMINKMRTEPEIKEKIIELEKRVEKLKENQYFNHNCGSRHCNNRRDVLIYKIDLLTELIATLKWFIE